MSIQKIEEVYLYFSDVTGDAAENTAAVAFMDHSGIPFTRLMYNDISQCQEVLNAVNTWWADDRAIGDNLYAPALPALTKYPFLVYTEVHNDVPARYSPVRYASGLAAIQAFPALYTQYNT
jgi:hypothetical protein